MFKQEIVQHNPMSSLNLQPASDSNNNSSIAPLSSLNKTP